jgi:CBS domain-containing protein
MTVRMILRQKGSAVHMVTTGDSVGDVARLLDRHRIGAALVEDAKGAIVGVISERDIVLALARRGGACLDVRVAEIMSSPVATCKPSDSVNDLMHLMTERRIRHVPVMDEGELAGIISIGDVVKYRINQVETEVSAMRAYIATG